MDLLNILQKLQQVGQVEEAKKPDFLDLDKDGDTEEPMKKAAKANEDIESVLRGLAAIQEGNTEVKEDEVEEGNEFAKKVQDLKAQGAKPGTKFTTSDGKEHVLEDEQVEECGSEYSGEMSPLSTVDGHSMGINAPKDRYSLSIQRGDKNLNVNTDSPEELLMIMKLAGVMGNAQIGQEQMATEEFANTPDATGEREPRAYGDIRDWGFKGTGKGKPGSALNKPFGQGDNPLGEEVMLEEYKQFKQGK